MQALGSGQLRHTETVKAYLAIGFVEGMEHTSYRVAVNTECNDCFILCDASTHMQS